LAEPLNRQWAEWGAEAQDQFLVAALEEATWKQTRYGIPLDISTLVLLYNQDHFDEANLPYPEGDYDIFSFRDAAATLSRPEENRYGLGFTTDPWYVYAWLAGAGGDVLVGTPETGFSLTLNSESNIDALRFLTGMVQAGHGQHPITRPRDYEDARKQFLAGQVSMYIGGPWDIHLIQSAYPDFPLGVARLPKTPAADSAASVLGGSGLFIPRGARHRDVAFEFMKWATSDRYAIPMARRLGRYPAKVWLQTSPYFAENLLLVPFFNQLNAARPYHLDLFPRAEELFVDAVKASFYGVDPAEALNEAQEKGQFFVGENSP
jgi:multiple sugar transport system substrate-binding protein